MVNSYLPIALSDESFYHIKKEFEKGLSSKVNKGDLSIQVYSHINIKNWRLNIKNQ
jgi:hypothetical protein